MSMFAALCGLFVLGFVLGYIRGDKSATMDTERRWKDVVGRADDARETMCHHANAGDGFCYCGAVSFGPASCNAVVLVREMIELDT